MKKLTVLFPGIGYHCDKPLLYYGKRIAAAAGYAENISLSYSYEKKNIRGNATEMEKAFYSLYAQAEEQLGGIDFKAYDAVLFIAKSVGTIIASAYAAKHNVKCRMVLYTPLIQTFDQPVGEAAAFIGTGDPWSDVDEVIRAGRKQNVPIYTYEKANHSLETGDAIQNLDILKDVMLKTEAFIKGK